MPTQSVLRRASLFVRDMERTLSFYGGTFGLTPYIDRIIDLAVLPDLPLGQPGRGGSMRFVILKGWDPLIGMIGFMEPRDPPLEDPHGPPTRLGFNQPALVLETRDIGHVAAAIPRLGGRMLMAPKAGRNLGDAAGNFIPAQVMFASDPDGHFLEVFEAL